jgi:hypothetical protein
MCIVGGNSKKYKHALDKKYISDNAKFNSAMHANVLKNIMKQCYDEPT